MELDDLLEGDGLKLWIGAGGTPTVEEVKVAKQRRLTAPFLHSGVNKICIYVPPPHVLTCVAFLNHWGKPYFNVERRQM